MWGQGAIDPARVCKGFLTERTGIAGDPLESQHHYNGNVRKSKNMEIKYMENRNESGKKQKAKGLCPNFGKCGGCQYLDVPYEEQLKKKKKQLTELLKPFCQVRDVIGMEDPWHYRNKVHAVIARDRKGRIISGVYKEGTHFVLPVDTCLIEDQKADDIIRTIRELVTASPVFTSKNNFVKALRAAHPEITTVVQNINGRGTSMVLGEKEHVLYGPGFIVDELCGFRFRISSRSFYQINPVQTEKLYRLAIQAAGLTGKETVIDAYCGIGTIGIAASPEAKEVIGVELNPDAVRDAVTNAKVNGVKNIRFYCNDAGKFMVQMASQGGKADVVFMDPPRSGSTEEFINAVATLKPVRVVYVSCGPDTLARDLAVFKRKGYEAKEAWGVDMFPFTGHTECVVKLERAN